MHRRDHRVIIVPRFNLQTKRNEPFIDVVCRLKSFVRGRISSWKFGQTCNLTI